MVKPPKFREAKLRVMLKDCRYIATGEGLISFLVPIDIEEMSKLKDAFGIMIDLHATRVARGGHGDPHDGAD